ncbi:10164_t:CDS:1, partial [Racocetra fulgida]
MTSNTKDFDGWSDTPPKQVEEEKVWGDPPKNLSKADFKKDTEENRIPSETKETEPFVKENNTLEGTTEENNEP